MKILMVRATRDMGGAEIYNLNLIKGFKKYYPSDQLFFITTLPEFGKRIKLAGAKVIIIPIFSEEVGTKRGLLRLFWHLPKYLFYYLGTIIRLCHKEKISLVCFQSATEKIVLTPILSNLGFRIIWIEHGPFFSHPTAKEVLFLYRVAGCWAKKIIAVSENTRVDAINGGIHPRRLVCVQTGIDYGYFFPLPKERLKGTRIKLKLKSNEKIVGYLGDICKKKGIEEFLRIGRLIIGKRKAIRFLLVGRGSMLGYAKDFVKRYRLEKRFIFAGFQEDVRPYLGIFDLILYPNYIGSLSLSLMEAMGMGVPVVARDIGGNRELVLQGRTGYLFKDETPGELADIIINLLKDEKKRKAMGEAARERVMKYFNQERWVKELYSVFEEVAKNEK